MYLLAAACFVFGLYSAVLGDASYAMYAMAAGAVLVGARYFFGSFGDAELHSRTGYTFEILIFIIVAIFGIDEIFGLHRQSITAGRVVI